MTRRRTFDRLGITLAVGALVASAASMTRFEFPTDRASSIHSSAIVGDVVSIRSYLLALGDVEARTESGRTLLMSACAAPQARPSIVELLIAHGAEVNATDINGRTALMYAADMDPWLGGSRHLDVVQRLLAAGARPELRDQSGQNARSLAEAQGRNAVAKVLQLALSTPGAKGGVTESRR